MFFLKKTNPQKHKQKDPPEPQCVQWGNVQQLMQVTSLGQQLPVTRNSLTNIPGFNLSRTELLVVIKINSDNLMIMLFWKINFYLLWNRCSSRYIQRYCTTPSLLDSQTCSFLQNLKYSSWLWCTSCLPRLYSKQVLEIVMILEGDNLIRPISTMVSFSN